MKYIKGNPEDVLVIGNGFDLNLGLKTGYCDFIKSNQFIELLSTDNDLAEYLEEKNTFENWIDIENELKHYSTVETLHRKSSSKFEENFEALSNALLEYLKTIDYSDINKNSVAYSLLRKVASKNFLILDFNYTDTTKILLRDFGVGKFDIGEKLLKIHGSVEENEIIFGVEDNAEIKPNHVFLHKAYPPHFKGYSFGSNLKHLIRLHIFGHSLGKTDHTYFMDFFQDQVAKESLCKEIYLYHYGKDGYKELHKQIYTLTSGRLSAFKEINHFVPRDVKTLSSKLV